MGLYTRTGDGGETGLLHGVRVRKDDPRVRAYGTVDELNAHLGLAASMAKSGDGRFETIRDRVCRVQNTLFSIGAELATPVTSGNAMPESSITPDQITELEHWIDEAEAVNGPIRDFILPGGHLVAAQLHVCRTVCRRAERRIVSLRDSGPVNSRVVAYVNRLADLLFAWARLANHLAGEPDVKWRKDG